MISNAFLFICFISCSLAIDSPSESIVFDLNSEIIRFNNMGLTQNIEAFIPITNGKILKERDEKKYDDLEWFSFGKPTILASEDQSPFHFSSKGFYIQVETLTKSHRKLIIEELENKYNIELGENQVKNLIPSRFECRLEIECDEFFYLDGEVVNTKEFPLKVNFNISKTSREMKCLQAIIRESEDDFNFDCHLSSHLKHPDQTSASLIGRMFVFNKDSIKTITSGDKCLKQFEQINERVNKLERMIAKLVEKSKQPVQPEQIETTETEDEDEPETIDLETVENQPYEGY